MAPVNNIVQINNNEHPPKYKVTIVGSGNWGSVASKLIASNTLKLSSFHGLSSRLKRFNFFMFFNWFRENLCLILNQ